MQPAQLLFKHFNKSKYNTTFESTVLPFQNFKKILSL
jgi:hypothetical protein